MARGFASADSEYLNAASAAITNPNPSTLATWVRPGTLSTFTQHTILCFNNDNGNGKIELRFITRDAGNAWTMGYIQNSGGVEVTVSTSNNSWVEGTWYHLVFRTVGIADRYVYWNGGNEANDTTFNTDNWSTVDSTGIGAQLLSGSGARYFNGDIAEAAAWNVALDTSEIAALAAGYSPQLIRPSGLQFYAPLIRDEDRDIVAGTSFSANGTPTVETHTRIIYPSLPLWVPAPSAAAGLSVNISPGANYVQIV